MSSCAAPAQSALKAPKTIPATLKRSAAAKHPSIALATICRIESLQSQDRFAALFRFPARKTSLLAGEKGQEAKFSLSSQYVEKTGVEELLRKPVPKILLTGQPGVGKTTIIVRLASLLGNSAAGFYTAELRERGQRVGFKVVTLGGDEEILAHVKLNSPHRVGRYRVNVTSLGPAFAEIENVLAQHETRYLLIDEIGKMELLVPGFKRLITRVLESSFPLVATVPAKPLAFTDALKKRPDVILFQVTAANREKLPAQVYAMLSTIKP